MKIKKVSPEGGSKSGEMPVQKLKGNERLLEN